MLWSYLLFISVCTWRIFIVTVHMMSSYTSFINEASCEAKENCSRIFLNDNVGVANSLWWLFLYLFVIIPTHILISIPVSYFNSDANRLLIFVQMVHDKLIAYKCAYWFLHANRFRAGNIKIFKDTPIFYIITVMQEGKVRARAF